MHRRLTLSLLLLTLIGAGLFSSHRSPTAFLPTTDVPLFAQGYSFTNPAAYWVPPGACNTAVSGNATGTQGLTVAGGSNLPVVQAQTSVTGTNTHTYICNISPPYTLITTDSGFTITDAVFFYAPESALATQAATLASGTMNSAVVFSAITYPTSAASETPSTVTPVRADAGTLTITPVVASFNVSTVTAGSFYSVKFTPSTPIVWKTDLKQLLLTVTLQLSTALATKTNSPGVLVHFSGQ